MGFTNKQTKIIQKNIEVLAANTFEFNRLFLSLQSRQVFTKDETKRWMRKPGNEDEATFTRNFDFYQEIIHKDPSVFVMMVEALQGSGHREMAKLLSEALNGEDDEEEEEQQLPNMGKQEDEMKPEVRDINLAKRMRVRMTKENIKILHERFKEFDDDGNGKLSFNEFYDLMKICDWTEEQSRHFFQANDTDGNDGLDWMEFSKMCFEDDEDEEGNFLVTEAMKTLIINMFRKDICLLDGWNAVIDAILQEVEHKYVTKEIPGFYDKSSKTLDYWMSSKSTEATFDKLVGAIRQHSNMVADELWNNRDSIRHASSR